jgi:hypothetical protein
MPSFCRHNRLVQNCPICSKEQDVEMRPVLSPGGQTVRQPRPGGTTGASTSTRRGAVRSGSGRGGARASGGLTVRRLSRAAEDGFRSPLVPGLRSGADADRLAQEIAFAATRLERLASDPPGLYAEVADASLPIEERTWLAFLIAYLGPRDGDDPFAGIAQARTAWNSGELPVLDDVPLGPRTAHDPARGQRTLDAYRQWAQRSGSQEAAFTGDAGWTPERRFARVFERLALPGLHRGACSASAIRCSSSAGQPTLPRRASLGSSRSISACSIGSRARAAVSGWTLRPNRTPSCLAPPWLRWGLRSSVWAPGH